MISITAQGAGINRRRFFTCDKYYIKCHARYTRNNYARARCIAYIV